MNFCTGAYLYFKVQCLPQIEGGVCLLECHLVTQTQDYHVVFIWG